jgi:hypothetical protein
MWKTLMDWLPDLTVGGTITVGDMLQTVFSIAGGVLALVAVVYAWRVATRQFAMMRDQDKLLNRQLALSEEQTASMTRQEQLAERLQEITKRQADIAEKQDRIMQEQLARQPVLKARATKQSRSWQSDSMGYGPVVVTIEVWNKGYKATDGFYWAVLIPRDLIPAVQFNDEMLNTPYRGKFTPLSELETDVYYKADGHYEKRLFPLSAIDVVQLSIAEGDRSKTFAIKWRLVGDDGPVPAEGFAEIVFTRLEGGTYDTELVFPFVVSLPAQAE